MVDVRDVARAAAAVLASKGHENKAYDLTGPEALSLHDVADRLGAVLRQQVLYADQPPAKVVGALLASEMPEWLAKDVTALYDATLFPDIYRRCCHLLSPNRPYVVRGLVEETFGVVTLTVHDLRLLEPTMGDIRDRLNRYEYTGN